MEQKMKIAVLGGGTMGPGIAVSYALGGYPTTVYSRSEKTVIRAESVCRSSLSLFVEEGMITAQQMEVAMALLRFSTDLKESVSECGYIAETIVEKPDAKQELYEKLDAILPEDVIIASNTSYLDIFTLMPQRRLPYTVIAHFYAPAHILPLVEVVKGSETLDSVMEETMQLHRSCGKTAVRMEKYIPGFIVNRMQSAMTREVIYLIENGYCTPEELDLAVKTSLMPRGLLLGLVQRYDFNGLDMAANGLNNKKFVPSPEPDHPAMIFDHVDKGEYGVKTGQGIYSYTQKPYEEVLRQRDKMLLQSVRLAGQFMDNPLHDKD